MISFSVSKKIRRCAVAGRKKSTGKRVRFTLNAPEAREVKLAGDFNNWDPIATSLRKGRGKLWAKDMVLKPGRYEYKFVIDGEWLPDPDNKNVTSNSFGSHNSVVEI
ncbi:MAG: glycoside hydrolase [Candidatus Omnitrophica bacterium]|nr:glycoside hydrolase [Candidatus Omnitrophota bacterium]MBD3268963.1 glycoside hydrolase [Candidatus Omnitrophota bacterium]